MLQLTFDIWNSLIVQSDSFGDDNKIISYLFLVFKAFSVKNKEKRTPKTKVEDGKTYIYQDSESESPKQIKCSLYKLKLSLNYSFNTLNDITFVKLK